MFKHVTVRYLNHYEPGSSIPTFSVYAVGARGCIYASNLCIREGVRIRTRCV